MPSKRCVRWRPAKGSCASRRQRIPVSCKFLSKTLESGWVKKTWTVYSILFTQPSQMGLEWDYPSAVLSLKLMEVDVFVIDDDTATRETLSSLIRSVGLCVQLFASAEEFLRCKRPDRDSCFVLDIRLRGMSGLDF